MVRQQGCTLSVAFLWSCFVDAGTDCKPQIAVQASCTGEDNISIQYLVHTFKF